jgi:hypothetical protein
VGIGQSEEGGQRRWYGFNASVSAREGRRQDEALSEDEAEAERAHLGSMERKRGITQQHEDVGGRSGTRY